MTDVLDGFSPENEEEKVLGTEDQTRNRNRKAKTQGKTQSQKSRKEGGAIEPLPFELERPPKEWTPDERYAWIVAYMPLLRKAEKPYRALTKITYHEEEDLTQIIMEVALRCFDSYNPEQNTTLLSTYVYRAITNEFVSYFRAANAGKRKGEFLTGSLSDIQKATTDDFKNAPPPLEPNCDFSLTDTLRVYINDVEVHACNTLLLEEIKSLLRTCFAEEDAAIFWRVVTGESQLDVAASLGIPQSTVSKTVRTVRTRLVTYMRYSKMLVT